MASQPLVSVQQTRREFCTRACQLASLAAVGALSACGSNATSPDSFGGTALTIVAATRVGGGQSVNIDSTSPLNAVGGMALVQSSTGDFLVTRTDQSTFIALTAICTHQSCTVSGADGGNFLCPCHGSEYSPNGAVVRGPANAPLRSFATQFSNGVLTIAG